MFRMATSSITRAFIIHDDAACDRLIKALNEPVQKKEISRNYYEEGKKKLAEYFGH